MCIAHPLGPFSCTIANKKLDRNGDSDGQSGAPHPYCLRRTVSVKLTDRHRLSGGRRPRPAAKLGETEGQKRSSEERLAHALCLPCLRSWRRMG
eukprot:2673-Chlamydomonas_euryale.AAC.1